MNCILLAGGQGTRISKQIGDMPKCCLPLVNNQPLIRFTVEYLLKRSIKVYVCTGYKANIVKKALYGLKVKYFHNPFYKETNSLGTIWFSRDAFNDDLIIMNADVYADNNIFDLIIKTKEKCFICSDSSKRLNGDYFLKTDKNHNLLKYGKELTVNERTEEYVGLAYLSKNYAIKYLKNMEKFISEGKYNLWWENPLYELALDNKNIKVKDVKGNFWSEVDYYEDYIKIISHLKYDKRNKKQRI